MGVLCLCFRMFKLCVVGGSRGKGEQETGERVIGQKEYGGRVGCLHVRSISHSLVGKLASFLCTESMR